MGGPQLVPEIFGNPLRSIWWVAKSEQPSPQSASRHWLLLIHRWASLPTADFSLYHDDDDGDGDDGGGNDDDDDDDDDNDVCDDDDDDDDD